MDKIICGGFEWVRNPAATDNRIDGGSLFLANAIAQDELSIDTLEADIWSLCRVPLDFEPADYDGLETADGKIFCCASGLPDLTTIPYGTPVEYWRNNALIARLYKSNILRVGVSTYRLSAVSAIGLLDKLPHSGGLYTGQTAGEVLADIIGGTFAYTIAFEVANIKVFGWIPAATRRDNLRQLLFATGAAVRKLADGTINFAFLSASSPLEIINDRIYTGGKVSYNAPATGVDVTEHTYFAFSADRENTLFDNTTGSAAADRQTVSFDSPCHDLAATGLTVHESGVNYAIVSGTGTLTGKEYTHQTKIISRRLTTTASENIKTVQGATLVSMANSGSVADRVLAYYSGAKTLTAGIVAGTERPGDAVTLEDAFDDLTAGLMESISINISATLRGDATFITGYIPTHIGNDYNNRILLTEGENWVVPSGIDRIRVVLIAGGSGGTDGENGGISILTTPSDGYVPWTYSGLSATHGGKGGSGGQAGKVRDVIINVSAEQSFPVSIGAGGAVGSSGGATTFGDYSSEDGSISASGYADLMTSTIYAAPGDDGIDGGDGGSAEQSGGSAGSYSGGYGAASKSGSLRSATGTGGYVSCSYSKGGSGGGGAAIGASGGSASGAIPYAALGAVYPNPSAGLGASAADREIPASYGSGGHGGHGGGGNGQYNSVSFTNPSTPAPYAIAQGIWTEGGSGGKASAGRQGCVIIYY